MEFPLGQSNGKGFDDHITIDQSLTSESFAGDVKDVPDAIALEFVGFTEGLVVFDHFDFALDTRANAIAERVNGRIAEAGCLEQRGGIVYGRRPLIVTLNETHLVLTRRWWFQWFVQDTPRSGFALETEGAQAEHVIVLFQAQEIRGRIHGPMRGTMARMGTDTFLRFPTGTAYAELLTHRKLLTDGDDRGTTRTL
jgi:hypothetical protein